MHHVAQSLGSGEQVTHGKALLQFLTAITEKDADLWSLFTQGPLCRINLGDRRHAVWGEERGRSRCSARSLDHRFRDIPGVSKGPAHKDAFHGRLCRLKLIGLTEPLRIQLQTDLLRKIPKRLRRCKSQREDDRV